MQLKLYRGVWHVYWREQDHTGKTIPRRSSLRTSDQATARRRYSDFLKSLEQKPETVGDIVDLYLKDIEGKSSADVARHNWKALKPHFGHLRPDQVTIQTCREYTAKRQEKGRSGNTIIRELGVMSAALHWHDKFTPARFEMPSKPAPRNRYLSKDESRALIGAAVAPHIKLFIILALTTAGRASAILDLTWEQIDFTAGRIYLSKGSEAKNKRRATVPMNKTARDALIEAQKAALSDFVVEWAGGKVNDVKRGVKRTADRAGLKDVSAHVLRHTAAVWMAEAGVPMSEISQYLGHTSTSVTERVYARYSPEHLRTASEALEIT